MKVTVRFDEAAGLSPEQVKVEQAKQAAKREFSRKWGQCERVKVLASGFNGTSVASLLERVQVVR